jgi:glutamate carboxypeptidase
MRFSALAALIIALSAASSARAQLTTAEQAMIRTVDVEQTRTVSMLTRWVEQNSGTLNLPGVAAVGKIVGAELQPLGMELQWIEM